MELKAYWYPIISFVLIGIIICVMEREKIMDKIFREKNSFYMAIEALKEGKTIHRSGDIKYYCTREILCEGIKTIEYGYRISDRKFNEGAVFRIEEILAEDWIIKENK